MRAVHRFGREVLEAEAELHADHMAIAKIRHWLMAP